MKSSSSFVSSFSAILLKDVTISFNKVSFFFFPFLGTNSLFPVSTLPDGSLTTVSSSSSSSTTDVEADGEVVEKEEQGARGRAIAQRRKGGGGVKEGGEGGG